MNGIDYSKDNIYDAIGRPDLKPKNKFAQALGKLSAIARKGKTNYRALAILGAKARWKNHIKKSK